MLDQEGGVETDEGQPEVDLAEAVVQQSAGHLREPEVHAAEDGEHDGAEQHIVEVSDHKVAVGHMPVDRWGGQQNPGQAAEQEGDQKTDGEHHRCFEAELPSPHGADPVEELDAGGNGDEVGQQ